jgi:hypothetical protein
VLKQESARNTPRTEGVGVMRKRKEKAKRREEEENNGVRSQRHPSLHP